MWLTIITIISDWKLGTIMYKIHNRLIEKN